MGLLLSNFGDNSTNHNGKLETPTNLVKYLFYVLLCDFYSFTRNSIVLYYYVYRGILKEYLFTRQLSNYFSLQTKTRSVTSKTYPYV